MRGVLEQRDMKKKLGNTKKVGSLECARKRKRREDGMTDMGKKEQNIIIGMDGE